MSRAPKIETYYVEGRIGLSVGLEVQAKTLEEAIEKSKAMTLGDFVEILGDHNDSNFGIAGVSKFFRAYNARYAAPPIKSRTPRQMRRARTARIA